MEEDACVGVVVVHEFALVESDDVAAFEVALVESDVAVGDVAAIWPAKAGK